MLYEILRIANIVLSAAACHLLLVTVIRRWDQLTRRIKRISIAMCGLLVYICYGTAEAIANASL